MASMFRRTTATPGCTVVRSNSACGPAAMAPWPSPARGGRCWWSVVPRIASIARRTTVPPGWRFRRRIPPHIAPPRRGRMDGCSMWVLLVAFGSPVILVKPGRNSVAPVDLSGGASPHQLMEVKSQASPARIITAPAAAVAPSGSPGTAAKAGHRAQQMAAFGTSPPQATSRGSGWPRGEAWTPPACGSPATPGGAGRSVWSAARRVLTQPANWALQRPGMEGPWQSSLKNWVTILVGSTSPSTMA
mmetsp:Transcript_4454/g.7336  ORF Transcript_4454/g.7336 Transcript_4454/m.7336 type:complete len:246 (+) Transcript_4454:60-797(+)